jgi:hypothetical protein
MIAKTVQTIYENRGTINDIQRQEETKNCLANNLKL